MGIWSCLELQRCGLGESVLPSGMKKYTQQTVVGIFLVFAAMIGGCSTTLPPTFSAESIRELETSTITRKDRFDRNRTPDRKSRAYETAGAVVSNSMTL